jgi:hypothetical protein
MSFVLLVVGIFLLVAAVRDKQDDLFALMKNDLTGQSNFIYWFVAIMAIGALGYIEKLKPISTALLALIILVLVLKKGNPSLPGGGLFQQLTQGLKSTATAPAAPSQSQTIPLPQTAIGNYFPGPSAPATIPFPQVVG